MVCNLAILFTHHMLEWNSRHRPLSFSHQDAPLDGVKNHRQLRHSYSQREVSRYAGKRTEDSLASSTLDLKKSHTNSVESVGAAWSTKKTSAAKSTPFLGQPRAQQRATSSTDIFQSAYEEVNNMVSRRFKKGSVYDALSSSSGLDFAPVVQLKTFHTRKDDPSPLLQATSPSDKSRESQPSSQPDSGPAKDSSVLESPKSDESILPITPLSLKQPPKVPEIKPQLISKPDVTDPTKKGSAHEKYPSWPVVDSEAASVTCRSHSWTGQTDYPKERVVYSRPKKAHQFKILANQLQPVLERAPEYNSSSKPEPQASSSVEKNNVSESHKKHLNGSSSEPSECNGDQFDFEAFHTPCKPQCYGDKDFQIHSPPELDTSNCTPSKTPSEAPSNDSNGFLSRYEDVLRNQAQYSVPLSSSSKQGNENKSNPGSPDTPFLDRLCLENNSWQVPPPPVPPTVAINPNAVPQMPPQHAGHDFEVSSENGTWMGSMESSSHGRSIPKWQGSYSDLSTLSTQLSNRSSLFDSGHSTMPESGRFSPQSSCDSTAPSLLLEGPTRSAKVIARHGCHREIVAYSARVQQPERHGSESVLYYGPPAPNHLSPSRPDLKIPSIKIDGPAEEGLFKSQASVTLQPSTSKSDVFEAEEKDAKSGKCIARQNSRKSSLSHSSEDSYMRSPATVADDTSCSSSDVSNVSIVTCIPNYKNVPRPQSLDKTLPNEKPVFKSLDQQILKFDSRREPPKSKSLDETARKFIFPEVDKRQRVSDPELKAIQKQAVYSFYQRMSLAESIKSDTKSIMPPPGGDSEAPPPYEATSTTRIKMPPPRLSLPPKVFKFPPRALNQKSEVPLKAPDSGLHTAHSKSVPNLVILKGQNSDVPPSHPIFKQSLGGPKRVENQLKSMQKNGPMLAKDEIIPWDQLPNVLQKKREAMEKAPPSSEIRDPPEDNGNCSSGIQYAKTRKSPRKVQLKEVHHSDETASVKVITADGVTLVKATERKEDKKGPHKRRPAPPPPPKQPPRRPPPPPPPASPPPSQVVVDVDENVEENSRKHGETKADDQTSSTDEFTANSISCESPELPLPPLPFEEETALSSDEPSPLPPESQDADNSRMLDSTLIYPKNSYMSYRCEKKIARQGFDGKYRRSLNSSTSSIDLSISDSNSSQDGKNTISSKSEDAESALQQSSTSVSHTDVITLESVNQESGFEECVPSEMLNESVNISGSLFGSLENCQSSNGTISPSTELSEQHTEPCQPSHETVTSESQISSNAANCFVTKETSFKSKYPDVPGNMSDNPLDNTKNEETQMKIENGNTDHNQNSMEIVSEQVETKMLNGNDLINGNNNDTHAADTPKSQQNCNETNVEATYEPASNDYVHYMGDVALKNLLIPTPSNKTITDYLQGLLNIELEKNGYQAHVGGIIRPKKPNNPEKSQNKMNGKEENSTEEGTDVSESLETNDDQNIEELDIKKKKEEMIFNIGKKINNLKEEQKKIRLEMAKNEVLGQDIFNKLKEVAKPNEMEKYSIHVEETAKIMNLLLSLSGRLTKVENMLKNMSKDAKNEEKGYVELKRDRLKEQHEDALRLKESIDRRSIKVSTFLLRYFSKDDYVEYERFIKMKTELIVKYKEIEDKINLGEEQLAAFAVVSHIWKSANS